MRPFSSAPLAETVHVADVVWSVMWFGCLLAGFLCLAARFVRAASIETIFVFREMLYALMVAGTLLVVALNMILRLVSQHTDRFLNCSLGIGLLGIVIGLGWGALLLSIAHAMVLARMFRNMERVADAALCEKVRRQARWWPRLHAWACRRSGGALDEVLSAVCSSTCASDADSGNSARDQTQNDDATPGASARDEIDCRSPRPPLPVPQCPYAPTSAA